MKYVFATLWGLTAICAIFAFKDGLPAIASWDAERRVSAGMVMLCVSITPFIVTFSLEKIWRTLKQ